MELKLTQEELSVWSCGEPLEKQSLISAESVVPDTLPDIGRIVWTQGGLLLKGKELRPEGVSVSGEVWASVLYLTEGLDALESLRLTKPFRMDFENARPDAEAMPTLRWRLDRVEARALNPRKLQASFVVSAQLRCYEKSSLPKNTALPDEREGLYLLRRQQEVMAVTGVWEKQFSLREQLPVSAGRPCPEKILGEELHFEELQAERLGPRTVFKGSVKLSLWGLDDRGLPQRQYFSLPFSQLLDTGETEWSEYSLHIEPSSAYLSWVESAAGERSLDAEIHAVAQLCVYDRVTTVTAADAYSTRMPCQVQGEERRYLRRLERENVRLRADTTLPMPDDAGELLAVQRFWEPLEANRESTGQSLTLDLLYRKKDGGLACARRSLRLEQEAVQDGARLQETRETLLDLRPEEDRLHLRCESEASFLREERQSVFCVTGLALDEDRACGIETLPELFLVRRREGEGLWDLAKAYRSSVEAIAARNPEDAELLLVPRE